MEKFLEGHEQIIYRYSIPIPVNIAVGLYRYKWASEEITPESKRPGCDADKFHPEPRLLISETVPLHTI